MEPKIKYTKLNDITNPQDYNFYGIIIDATYPSIDEKGNYLTAIKVISQESNFLMKNNEKSSFQDCVIHIIIKSSSKEDTPYINKVGDIIRIHNGVYRHKTRRNIYLNLTSISKLKSSWLVFDCDEKDLSNERKYQPKQSSSYYLQVNDDDTSIINSLRKWKKVYFQQANSLFYSKTVTLNYLNEMKNRSLKLNQKEENNENDEGNSDLDILCIVCSLDKDLSMENQKIGIFDGCSFADLVCSNRYDYINEGEVIRIRSIIYEKNTESKGTVSLNVYSNILIIDKSFHISISLMKEIHSIYKNTYITNILDLINHPNEVQIRILVLILESTIDYLKVCFDKSSNNYFLIKRKDQNKENINQKEYSCFDKCLLVVKKCRSLSHNKENNKNYMYELILIE